MRRPFNVKKTRFPSRRHSLFFKPSLEVLEDRRLLSGSGFLQGTVVNDQTGAVQAGATVTLSQPGNPGFTPQSQTTGANGSYLFTGLAAGTYQLVETPPSGYANDSTLIVQSPVVSASSINSSTIQATIPSSVQLSLNGSQFNLSGTNFNGTNNTPGIASTEILSFKFNGAQESNIFVGQFIASANGGPSFYTFCVDQSPGHQLSSGSNVFTAQTQPDLTGEGSPINNNPTTVGEIAYLYNQFGTAPLSSVNAAALQVAIWTLEYNSTSDFQSSGDTFQLLGPNTTYISQSTYNSVVSQAQTYLSDAANHSGQATFLAPSGSPTSGGEQGVIAPGSLSFSNVPVATPSLTTQASENGNVVGSAVMSDTATLSGGNQVAAGSPAPTLTFNLIAPNGSTVYTETQTVTGTGSYTTTGMGTGSDVANQVGTYYWVVTYSGNTFNNSVTDNGQNEATEQETTVQATPQLTTQASENGNVVGAAVISDTATLSGGYQVAVGSPAPTLTFQLIAPNGSTVYTETQTVTGTGNYTTSGTGTGSDVATQVGTYYWTVTYSGNTFNSSVTHNGQNDTSEQETTVQATPQLTTQASETAGGVVGTSVISDTATLSGGYQVAAGTPAPTLTFSLIAPNGSTVYTETQTVTGTGSYTTTGTGTGSEVANQVGTYYWIVTYSGNTFNSSVTHNGQNDTSEQETTVKATPAISTTQQPASATVGSSVADKATVTGLISPSSSDTVTFKLYSSATTQNSSTLLFTDTETVSLSGGTATATSKGYTAVTTGTDYWVVTFNGDSNNNSVTSGPTDEPVTITSVGSVGQGQFATIGFWHNQNGQAVINSFNGGSTSTALGNWLATNFPNLFGTPNPYDSATLAQFGATSFAGLTNAQIATVYANLWNPSGVTKNTFVQAFAVALGIYADTSSLSGTNTLASKYGFIVTPAGFGSATYNIGSNGSAFGVPNNTALTVFQILTIVNNNFNPTTGTFYGGDQTKTSAANNVLNGINTTGDISASVLEADSLADDGASDEDSDMGIVGTESPDGMVFAMLAQTPTSGQQSGNVVWAGSDTVTLIPNSSYKPHTVDVLFAGDSWLPSGDLRSAHFVYSEDLLTSKDEGRIGKLATVLALISGVMLRSNAESRSRSRTTAEMLKKPEKV